MRMRFARDELLIAMRSEQSRFQTPALAGPVLATSTAGLLLLNARATDVAGVLALPDGLFAKECGACRARTTTCTAA